MGVNGDFQSDVGIKISQPFYDIKTAGDSQLIFNSSWPTIAVAFEKTLYASQVDFDNPDYPIAHNLGFSPFTVAWATKASDGSVNRFIGAQMDNSNIYPQWSASLTAFHIKCYNIDLGTTKTYPFISSPTTAGAYNQDFGIKLAKQDKLLSSTDLRDFILHSRAQSPLVAYVGSGDVSVDLGASLREISFTPTTTTALWAFGYQQSTINNRWIYAPYNSQSPPRTFITQNSNGTYTYKVQYFSTSGQKGCLIVLKDPMFAATDVRATY